MANILDRVVSVFSPEAGLRRIRARAALSALSGFEGGQRRRRGLKTFTPEGGDANADTLPDLPDLRARSRHLSRNNPIARGAITTKSTHTIGGGLIVNPTIDYEALGLDYEAARKWQNKAKAEFALACDTIDFTRVEHFNDFQLTAFNGMLDSGDAFGVRRFKQYDGDTYGNKIQLIEADRVCNPNHAADTDKIAGGIEHNNQGVPVAIHVANRHPGNLLRQPTSWRRIPLRYKDGRKIVLHLFDRERIGQSRGFPLLSPVIETIKSIGDYSHAEAKGALVSSLFTVFVTSETGHAPDGPMRNPTDGSDENEMELGSGAIIDLKPNEKVELANPTRPNTSFEAFINALCREVGMALEIPFELLIRHFTSSYSASRAALEMAYLVFRRDRGFFARRFCQPIYEFIVEEAVILGRLDAPGFFSDPAIRQAYLKSEWRGPARISLDPRKDADADRIDIESGVKDRDQVIAERTGGGDFDSRHAQLAREEEARRKDGVGNAGSAAMGNNFAEDDDDE